MGRGVAGHIGRWRDHNLHAHLLVCMPLVSCRQRGSNLAAVLPHNVKTYQQTPNVFFHSRTLLKREKKGAPKRQFCKKTAWSSYVQPWLVAIGSWQLAVGGWWRLVVGDWWLVAVGSGWQLAVGRRWRLVVVGGWRSVVPGGGP